MVGGVAGGTWWGGVELVMGDGARGEGEFDGVGSESRHGRQGDSGEKRVGGKWVREAQGSRGHGG